MRRITVVCLGACILLGGATGARAVVKCLGDSITEGPPHFDEEGRGGYPARLQPLLREGGMQGIVVRNFGVSAEDTSEMLARFGSLVSDGDTFVLLAGTNDVTRGIRGDVTLDDSIDNIRFMLDFARDGGMRVLVGTLIPRPPGSIDSRNTVTYSFVLDIRRLAHNRGYEVIDFWHALPSRKFHTFNNYYSNNPGDNIGHPNAAGFQVMAETAAKVILDGDLQSPVEGRFLAPGFVERVDADTDWEIELFDFDSGIQLSSATILINNRPMDTMLTGGNRKVTLFAAADGVRRCKAVLSVRANDRAEPPNELDLRVETFPTRQPLIKGDANGDCRVDGRDLAIFGPVFGTVEDDLAFDIEMDFVQDGAIDGEDFARLALNFGRGQLSEPPQ